MTLPESIGELSQLHHIRLDGTAVRSLPQSMLKCMKLEFIAADEDVLVKPPFNTWSLMDGAALEPPSPRLLVIEYILRAIDFISCEI
jgi:hypothetical protein